jgi:hypothetical protein
MKKVIFDFLEESLPLYPPFSTLNLEIYSNHLEFKAYENKSEILIEN